MVNEKVPSYLLEFPNEDFKKKLKIACAVSGMNMKSFILKAIEERINRLIDKEE